MTNFLFRVQAKAGLTAHRTELNIYCTQMYTASTHEFQSICSHHSLVLLNILNILKNMPVHILYTHIHIHTDTIVSVMRAQSL